MRHYSSNLFVGAPSMLRPTRQCHESLLRLRRRLCLRPPVPFERARQTFLKADLRLLPKKFSRLHDVPPPVSEDSIPRPVVLGFQRLSRNFSQIAANFSAGNASS